MPPPPLEPILTLEGYVSLFPCRPADALNGRDKNLLLEVSPEGFRLLRLATRLPVHSMLPFSRIHRCIFLYRGFIFCF